MMVGGLRAAHSCRGKALYPAVMTAGYNALPLPPPTDPRPYRPPPPPCRPPPRVVYCLLCAHD